MPTFYTMNIVHAIEYHPYRPHIYTRAVVEEVYAVVEGTPRRNCPISRFSTRTTISIFYNEELHVRQWATVSDYYIIRIVGAVRLWEAAVPKDKKKMCRNCPLPYSDFLISRSGSPQ